MTASNPFADTSGGAVPITTPDIPVYQDRRLSDYSAPAGDVIGALIGQAASELPSVQLYRLSDMTEAELGPVNAAPGNRSGRVIRDAPDSPLLSPTDAKAKLEANGLTGQIAIPDAGIRSRALDLLMEHRTTENRRNAITARSPGGFALTAAGVAGQLAVSLLDPINDVMGFIPVVGEARYAGLLARAGESVAARTVTRAAVGAAEGAAGMAALTPLQAATAHAYQDDYTMNDALAQVAFGGMFGAALHQLPAAAEWFAGRYRMGRGVPLEYQRAALSEGLSAVLEDRQPRVSEVMEALRREELRSGTSLSTRESESSSRPYSAATVTGQSVDIPVYHGTRSDFEEHSLEAGGSNVGAPHTAGRGLFFSTSAETAGKYAEGEAPGGNVRPEVVQANNPKIIEHASHEVSDVAIDDGKIADAIASAKREGHDALILRSIAGTRGDDLVVAFHPDQVVNRLGPTEANFAATENQTGLTSAHADQVAENARAGVAASISPPSQFDQLFAATAPTDRGLMGVLTQIRDDRVNLPPDDAKLAAETQRQTPLYDRAPTPEATEAELTAYAAQTDDAVNTALASGRLTETDKATLVEADQKIARSEYQGQGWKAAAACIARAFT